MSSCIQRANWWLPKAGVGVPKTGERGQRYKFLIVKLIGHEWGYNAQHGYYVLLI